MGVAGSGADGVSAGGGANASGVGDSGVARGTAGSGNGGNGGNGSAGGAPSSGYVPASSAPAFAADAGQAASGTASQSSSGGAAARRPDGYVAGRPEEPAPPVRKPTGDGPLVAATPLRPGEWYPTEAPPRRSDEEKEKNKRDAKKFEPPSKRPNPERGRDWALPDPARGALAISRPIRVECYSDRLVIVSEFGPENNQVVPFTGSTARTVEPFVTAIWKHMNSWGIAGRGMYWRPMLQITVAPDAERRFNELNKALDGSGLTLQRK